LKNEPCYLYEDNNLLVQGLPQAQKITKTIIFNNVLPRSIESITQDVPKETHELIKRYNNKMSYYDNRYTNIL
jgi:uncharacterized alpha-E superfamily protein